MLKAIIVVRCDVSFDMGTKESKDGMCKEKKEKNEVCVTHHDKNRGTTWLMQVMVV